MGLKDMRANAFAAKEAQDQERAAEQERRDAIAAQCRGDHYLTEVNRGSISMGGWQAHLNEMYLRGYRLAHAFEQDGNTVQVYEHHTH